MLICQPIYPCRMPKSTGKRTRCMKHKVKIETHGTIGRVYIDGKEVNQICGYTIEHNAREIPVINLRLLATEVEIDAEDVEIADGAV